jgi:ribonuclease Z
MKRLLATFLAAAIGSSVLATLSSAKPDQVDGVNVPFGRIPQEIVNNRYPRTYYPNTEKLGAGEMRIIALGTGMPNQSPSNVAASFLVEPGNGGSFLFDLGTGATDRLAGLEVDYSALDTVFASHLHVDHVGDFMGLHVGSWLSGRYTPLNIYGPSGSTPELGTATFVKGMEMAYAWDIATRTGALPDAGGKIEVHEFNCLQENQVVYQKNGVTIRSWPAIHSLDGSVSYGLEWNGLKYVFGGDTFPNKWYMK